MIAPIMSLPSASNNDVFDDCTIADGLCSSNSTARHRTTPR